MCRFLRYDDVTRLMVVSLDLFFLAVQMKIKCEFNYIKKVCRFSYLWLHFVLFFVKLELKTVRVHSRDLRDAKKWWSRNGGTSDDKFIEGKRVRIRTCDLRKSFILTFPTSWSQMKEKERIQRSRNDLVSILQSRTQIHKLKRETQTDNVATLSTQSKLRFQTLS